GKPTGADLRQGTVTLPLMYALQDATVAARLRAVLERSPLGDDDCAEAVELVRLSDGVTRGESRAHEISERARRELAPFPDGEARDTLAAMCDYVVGRRI